MGRNPIDRGIALARRSGIAVWVLLRLWLGLMCCLAGHGGS